MGPCNIWDSLFKIITYAIEGIEGSKSALGDGNQERSKILPEQVMNFILMTNLLYSLNYLNH